MHKLGCAMAAIAVLCLAACSSAPTSRGPEASEQMSRSRAAAAWTDHFAKEPRAEPTATAANQTEPRDSTGLASFYHPDGTAPGASTVKFTAAHRTLPIGTLVKVTNLSNGRSVTAKINDRGPFRHNRLIDLSDNAADEIGMRSAGIARVRMEVVQ